MQAFYRQVVCVVFLLSIAFAPAQVIAGVLFQVAGGGFPEDLQLRGTLVIAKEDDHALIGRKGVTYSFYVVNLESKVFKKYRVSVPPLFSPFAFDVEAGKVYFKGYCGPIVERTSVISIYDINEDKLTPGYEFRDTVTGAEFSTTKGTLILSVEDYPENENSRRTATRLYECAVDKQTCEEKLVYESSLSVVDYADEKSLALIIDHADFPLGSDDPTRENRKYVRLFNLNDLNLTEVPLERREFERYSGDCSISSDGRIVFLKSREEKYIGTEFPFRLEERAGVKIYFLEAQNLVGSGWFSDKFVVSPYNDFVLVPLTRATRKPKGPTYPVRVLVVDLKQNRVVYSFNTVIVGQGWSLIGWYK